MRVSTTVSALAVFAMTSIPSVAAAGQLGFALGVKQPGGPCKVQADYEADFDAIKKDSGSKIVRIYSAADCNVAKEILPAAKSKGFKVILGIWPETQESYNAGKNAILTHAVKYKDQVHAITVGSESLYRGTFTADQLVGKINDMRSAAPQFRYGTADSWNRYADGTADPVVRASDILLCNAFAYWQGASINEAVGVFKDDISQAFARVKSAAGGKKVELWVGETGWPTAGTKYQKAEPSLKNTESFYKKGVCPMVASGTNVFYFEAFDEPWKPDSIGADGNAASEKHWGAMTADRKEKFSLKC